MNYRKYMALTVIPGVLLLFLQACSGSMISAPDLNVQGQQDTQLDSGSSHVLWGTWDITIDPDTGEMEIVPIRGAMFNANVTMFLQPPIAPVNLLGIQLNPGTDIGNGYVDVNVTLQHPFKSLANFRGFDVRGIFLADGSQVVESTGATRTSPSEARVLNADGYTRWWNASEFGPEGKIFGFVKGKAGAQFYPTSTVNPYKYFSDALSATDPVESLDISSRGTFATNPGSNTRNYQIQFPMSGGKPNLKFQYSIDASWDLPDHSYAPGYPVEAFNESAQMREPYHILISDAGSNAWYDDAGNYGGEIHLNIEVFDWQTPSAGVSDQINALWVEAPVFGGAVDVLPAAQELPGSQPTSRIYSVVMADLVLTHSGEEEIFIAAQSSVGTYKPNIDGVGSGWVYPDGPLTAYAIGIINILDDNPCPNVPPVAVADQTKPLTGFAPLTVHLDSTGSYDPNESCGDHIALYEWDIDANGTYEYSNSDGTIIDHEFTDAGTYYIQLRVTDTKDLIDLLDIPLEIVVSAPMEDSWPMGHYDAGNTNYNPNSNVTFPLNLVYNLPITGNCYMTFISVDQKIYYPDSNGWLRCINQSDASPIWSAQVKPSPTGFWLGMCPAYWNGHIISGGMGMWSFDAVTGVQDWNVYTTSGFEHQGMVVVGDKIYVKSTSGTYKCMNASDGSEVWSIPWSVFPLMTTAYGEVNGIGYVVAPYNYSEKCVRASDGGGGWTQPVNIYPYGNVMAIDGYAYFGGTTIYKCNLATGVVAGSYNASGYQPLGMCYDGTYLYFALRKNGSPYDKKMISLDINMNFRWETPIWTVSNDHPVYSGGNVWWIKGNSSSSVYLTAFDPATGAESYQYPNPFLINAEANIVNVDNKLFYFSGGRLYCWESQ